MDLGLDGRGYIVTGGSGGLGFATARVLAREGARVLVTGRHEEGVDAAVGALGPNARGLVADNADAETPARLLEAAARELDSLDGALVSVGGPKAGPLLDISDEDWISAFEAVFLGGLRVGREIGRALAPGGSLAFVLSTSVKQPLAGLATSNGLRPGLAMAAKNLADELGPRGVRVNGLMPGRVETERVRSLDAQTGDAQAAKAAMCKVIPLGRYGEPEEFGRVAAFVLSPAASFVSGAMLPVDGGMMRSL